MSKEELPPRDEEVENRILTEREYQLADQMDGDFVLCFRAQEVTAKLWRILEAGDLVVDGEADDFPVEDGVPALRVVVLVRWVRPVYVTGEDSDMPRPLLPVEGVQVVLREVTGGVEVSPPPLQKVRVGSGIDVLAYPLVNWRKLLRILLRIRIVPSHCQSHTANIIRTEYKNRYLRF